MIELSTTRAGFASAANAPHVGIDLEFTQAGVPTLVCAASGTDEKNYLGASLNWLEAKDLVRSLVESDAILVGHAITTVDAPIIEKNLGVKIPLNRLQDTYIWAYLLNADFAKTKEKKDGTESRGTGQLDLWTMASLYTELNQWKACKGHPCSGPCPTHDPVGYNAMDGVGSVLALGAIREDGRRKGVTVEAYDHVAALSVVCEKMERNGVKVDVPYLRQLDQRIREAKANLFTFEDVPQFRKRVTKPKDGVQYAPPIRLKNDKRVWNAPFNPGSPKQVLEYFQAAGVNLKKTDRETLERASKSYASLKSHDDTVLHWLETLHEFKTEGKGTAAWFDEEKYIDALGYVHPRFITCGTSTGRLACVAPWTLIETSGGPKRIDAITTNDYVWTHKNRWRRVTDTYYKGVHQMWNVTFSNGQTLTCTGDHRLYVDFDQLDEQGRKHCGGAATLSLNGSFEQHSDSQSFINHTTQRDVRSQAVYAVRGVQDSQAVALSAVEDRDEQSNTGQNGAAAPQLDRRGFRWVRVSDLLTQWKTAVCPSSSDGGRLRGGRASTTISGSPYRWESAEQHSQQLSLNDRGGAQQDSSANTAVTITRLTAAGTQTVLDISVDEDESYLSCGVFSHNSSSPNFQNLPKHGAWSKDLRKALIPRSPDLELLRADSKQLELRMVLYLAGVEDDYGDDAFSWLVRSAPGLFEEAQRTVSSDQYKSVAEHAPGVLKGQRQLAKRISHAGNYLEGFQVFYPSDINAARTVDAVRAGALVLYPDWEYAGGIVGFTGTNLARALCDDASWESRRKALQIQEAYFGRFPQIRQWHRKVTEAAERGYVNSITGRYLALRGSAEERAKECASFWGQGGGADYVQRGMLALDAAGYTPLLNIHDENVIEIPRGMSDAAAYDLMQLMAGEFPALPGFRCPVDVERGPNYVDTRGLGV